MKLIFCTECQDIVKLHMKKPRACLCGKSSGFYTGETDRSAKISGPCVPLGFATDNFHQALRAQPKDGWGLRFDAFVIPKKADSIQVENEKE